MILKDNWICLLCVVLEVALLAGARPKAKVTQQKAVTSSEAVYCPYPCICQLQEAYCDGSSLENVPLGLPDDLTKVNLMNNHIKKIKKKHLGHLRNLKTLNLRQNELEHIEPGVFEHSNRLQALTFRDNLIKRVTKQTFKGLYNLEFLSLRANKLRSLEAAFQDLHHIQLLSLGGNKIGQISSKTFSGNGRLKYLDLHNNSITFINKNAFVDLHLLQYLILRDNPIKLVDLNFKKNFHLELLDFTNCKLEEMVQGLPSSIRDLRVSENNIKSLQPRDFEKTRKIRLLVISQNNLQYINNDTFAKLRYLDELEVSNNSLSTLPQKLPKSLRKISCGNNSLTRVYENDFHNNVNIEHIDLKLNQITEVDINAFKGLVKLKTLDLSRNYIDVLQPALFERARKLELLDLSYNPITEVEHNCFRGLDNLHILEMASVEAGGSFQPSVFKDTSHLLYLDLSNSSNVARHLAENPYFLNYISTVQDLNLMYNSLYSLPESFARNLPNLKSLKLIGNPWHCDRSIYWLTNWLKNNSVNFFEADHIVCASPPKLQGRRVDSLELRELPTVAPPLVDFIPTIEIIEINFHHNQSYRSNKTGNQHSEPSEDFVAKHPKPTLPTGYFSKTSKESLQSKKSSTPTQQTTTTTKLTSSTPQPKQITDTKVSTEAVTSGATSTVTRNYGVSQRPTLRPIAITEKTSTTTASPETSTSQSTHISTTIEPSKSPLHSEITKTTELSTPSKFSTSKMEPTPAPTKQEYTSTTSFTTTQTEPDTTTMTKQDTITTQIQESPTTQTSLNTVVPTTADINRTDYASPPTSAQIIRIHTLSSTESTVSTTLPETQPIEVRTHDMKFIDVSTTTTSQSTTQETTTYEPTTQTSTIISTTQDSTTAPSTTTQPPTSTITNLETTTSPSTTQPTTIVTEFSTATTRKQTLETRPKFPPHTAVNTPQTSEKNVSSPKVHDKTRKEENEPTIARITFKRFTNPPPKIYWATTARPMLTEKPKAETTTKDLISEPYIPYRGHDRNTDQSRVYDHINHRDNSNPRRPFSNNNPFGQRQSFHRIRHQGHGNHRHRNRGYPHSNKPFHGTHQWWSNSEAGPFSSLHNRHFSNVKNPGDKNTNHRTQDARKDTNSQNHDLTNRNDINAPLNTNREQNQNNDISDVADNNWYRSAPLGSNNERGDTWRDSRGQSSPYSTSRGHTSAFSSGEIDGAGSISQEIDDPSSGEYDIF